ncbi:hemolysin XhlA family protein [Paraclostridium sordellii]|uniref:hemolysin XhlA family protein n=1 Tax=Paraclostridium sordellii TaxID=1505 RepID=UPI0030CDC550
MNNEVADHMLEAHERRLNNHSERLDKLEQSDAKRDIQIDNLCKSIEGLVNTLKWGFFYAIQSHLFK